MAANHEFFPLVEVGSPEEAQSGTVGSAMPVRNLPEMKNYAEVEEVIRQVRDDLYPILTWTRQDRQTIDEEWRAIQRMEWLQHDEGRKYVGRSNTYLPVYTKILQTLVSSLSRGLFPSDEYLDVRDMTSPDPDVAKPVKQYLQWEFETVAKLRASVIKKFLRPFTNYGIGILKHQYRKDLLTVGKNVRKPLGAGVEPAFRPSIAYEGLHVTSRNPYNWYIYPTTVDRLEEAKVVFEDITVSRSFIKEMQTKRRWANIDAALNAPLIPQNTVAQAEELALKGQVAPLQLQNNELGDVRVVTEVWTFMVLPRSAYLDFEDPTLPIPVRIVMAGDIPLEVTRNPFFHQRPPYEVATQNTAPGSFYGYGVGRIVRYLQYMSNDLANQMNDCGIYGMNPVVMANPGLLTGPLPPLRPGVTWYMTDIAQGARFDRPPVEIVQYGQLLMNAMTGMMQDFSGAPPVLQGASAGRGAKTATGAQILQRNATQPIQDVVEDIELSVLIPLMRATWMNAQQYRESDVMASVMGGPPVRISPEQLLIDPEFRWLASSQAANQAARAQQAIQLIQAVMPLVPVMAQQGYVVDFAPLIKRVYSDGMGFRGFEQFIYKAQAAPGGVMPGQQPPPGVMQEQGDRVRSALEQVAGGGGAGGTDLQPGEGEDFMDVRNQADDLSAAAGSGGGSDFG